MTYTELIRAVKETIPGEKFSVEVTFWHHADDREHIEWSIWSVKREEFFKGGTADAALASLKGKLERPDVTAQTAKVDVA